MKKIIISILLIVSTLLAYDFGNVPEIKLSQIPKGKPLMVMVGKTKCIWCESISNM